MQPLSAAILLVVGIAGATAHAQTVPERRPALEATIRFETASGVPIGAITANEPFTIAVEIVGAAGAAPPAKLPLMGWLRPESPSNLQCAESAAAYRATERGPTDSIDLNRPVLGVLTQDNVLTIVDPERNLASANILAAQRFDTRPNDLVADPANGRFLVSLPDEGRIVAQPPLGSSADLRAGMTSPRKIVPGVAGGVLVTEADGAVLLSGSGSKQIADATSAVTAADGYALIQTPKQLMLLDPSGQVTRRVDAPRALDVALTGQAIVWLTPDALHLTWRDAEGAEQTIPLPQSPDHLAVDPSGRFALAYGRGVKGAVLIDLSRGRMVQQITSHVDVAEVAFAGGAAFLRLADQSVTGIIDLRLAGRDDAAPVGQFVMGDPMDASTQQDQRLLVPLTPQPTLLAIHPGNYTAFRLDATQATSNKPPMGALVLRGGVPRLVALLNRGFREVSPGRFLAAASLPGPGRYELVLSAGVGQASFCTALPVADPGTPAPEPARLNAEALAAGYRLRLTDTNGAPVANRQGRLTISLLTSNWRKEMTVALDANGQSEVLPLPSGDAVVVSLQLSDGPPVAPLLLEDIP